MNERNAPLHCVPERYVGLWRRRLLQDAQVEDSSTEVYWLQAGSLYADIRIPVPADGMERAAPEALARQQGFAGALEAQGDVLTWRRWLDVQPPVAVPDVGRMRFVGPDEMVEDGVHAAYREEWVRIGDASADRAAFSLQLEYADERVPRRRAGVLVVVGDYFMYALDRLETLPAGADLSGLLEDHSLSARQRDQLFACEISFGHRHAGGVPWRIMLSTLPQREGRSLFEVHGALTCAAEHRFEQRLPHAPGRRIWRQLERGERFRGFA